MNLDFAVILPEIVVSVTALLLLVVEMVSRPRRRTGQTGHAPTLIALLGLLVAAGLSLAALGNPPTEFQGMARDDNLARALNLIVLGAAVVGVLLAWEYIPRFSALSAEYYALLLLAVVGMMFLGKAVELITLFVALEILSIALYVLTGFDRHHVGAAEAALKYFLLGAFASGFVLYGAALLYAETGSTFYADLASRGQGGFFALTGLGLLLVGFGFKLAVVPFHMWAPDAYQGAPTSVTAFMAVATKAAAFVAFFRVLQALPAVSAEVWAPALAVLALLTMTLGNLAALRQRSLKRLLAYSSIAHAGYMLIGPVTGTADGLQALLYYLVVYAFMNMGAFGVVAVLESREPVAPRDADIAATEGLFARKPLLATVMAVFMLSLTGIPPLAGFFGKLYLFSAAVAAGWTWLAVAGVLNSVVSAYYYLRVTVAMFMKEPEPTAAPAAPVLADSLALALTLTTVGTLVWGLFAGPWLVNLGPALAGL